jgi:hypothetical protein
MPPFTQRQQFVRALVSRIGKRSDRGVYVRMFRDAGASKKAVKWSFELVGAFAQVQRYVDRSGDYQDFELLRWREPSPTAIKDLAAAARNRDVQPSVKSSFPEPLHVPVVMSGTITSVTRQQAKMMSTPSPAHNRHNLVPQP